MRFIKKLAPTGIFLFLCALTATNAATLPSGKLHVKVIEVETDLPIKECLVEIRNEQGDLVKKTYTDAKGTASFEIPYGFYHLFFKQELYESGEKNGYEVKQAEQHLVKRLYESTVAQINFNEAVALLQNGQIMEGRSLLEKQIANDLDEGGIMANLLKRTNTMEQLEKRMLSPQVEAIFIRQTSTKSMGILSFNLKEGGKLNQDLYPGIYQLAEDSTINSISNEQLVGKLLEIHAKRE